MQHKPLRDLLSGYDTYINAYAALLQSGQFPPSLEDDMYRLLKLAHNSEGGSVEAVVS